MKKYILGKHWTYESLLNTMSNEFLAGEIRKELLDFLIEKESVLTSTGKLVVVLGLLLRDGTELFDEPELYYNCDPNVGKVGKELFTFSVLKELLVLGVGFALKKGEFKVFAISSSKPPVKIVIFKGNEILLDEKLSDVQSAEKVREVIVSEIGEDVADTIGMVGKEICEFWADYWEFLDSLFKKKEDEEELEKFIRKIEKGELGGEL
jgi:hypothetical protein